LDKVTGTPTLTATPTGTPLPPIPSVLRGKIAFLSDRSGGQLPDVYVLDPETKRVALLTDRWPYEEALRLDRLSPDGTHMVSVTTGERGEQIYVTQLKTGLKWAITFSTRLSYDPAWSPLGDVVAYVSQEMGPEGGSDEIFRVNPQGSEKERLTFNTWEWDKHPTFSPDGSQIVFWSNQTKGTRQLWIMNLDGSDRRILLDSPYNDWDPVWIK
jgi:TolB protein